MKMDENSIELIRFKVFSEVQDSICFMLNEIIELRKNEGATDEEIKGFESSKLMVSAAIQELKMSEFKKIVDKNKAETSESEIFKDIFKTLIDGLVKNEGVEEEE